MYAEHEHLVAIYIPAFSIIHFQFSIIFVLNHVQAALFIGNPQ